MGDIKVESSVEQSKIDGVTHEGVTDPDEDSVVDDSNSGEPWVQGLMEGEYSDLSVEERLDALVALIAVANEGHSIRVVLEVCIPLFFLRWQNGQLTVGRYSWNINK